MPLNVAVIGVGYLGQYHAQKYAQCEQTNLTCVCDINQQRAQEIANQLQTTPVYNYRSLAGKVDAVSIVVPTELHYETAKFFLEHNIHVLVEKPIVKTINEADELIRIAKQQNTILQVGHLERFNQVFVALKKYINNPLYIESVRIAPFKPRGLDTNVVLDMMIHDIDIIQHILHSPIKHISANGAPVVSQKIDIASARLDFANHCTANFTASRVSQKTERKLRIFQRNMYISVDLHAKKLGVYQKGSGEMFPGIPNIISQQESYSDGDALKDEIMSFIDAISNRTTPVVTGEDGKQALITAMKITKILHQQPALADFAEFHT